MTKYFLMFLLLVYSPAGKVYIFDDSKGITVTPSKAGGFIVSDSSQKTIGFFSNGWAWTISDFKPMGEENWKTSKVGE